MMFTPSSLIWERAEYKVVVLPEPVGPVTSTIPYGFAMASMKSFSALGSNPKEPRSNVRFPASRIRNTIFSPKITGSVETRKSTTFRFILSLIRPSCGTRRSAMFKSERILIREVSAAFIFMGGFKTSYSVPSSR